MLWSCGLDAASLSLLCLCRLSPWRTADPHGARRFHGKPTILHDCPAAGSSKEKGRVQKDKKQAELSGAVAGLNAFMMSYPHDVPEWMPGVVAEVIKCGFADRCGG